MDRPAGRWRDVKSKVFCFIFDCNLTISLDGIGLALPREGQGRILLSSPCLFLSRHFYQRYSGHFLSRGIHVGNPFLTFV
ncbi:hypothetical protein BSCG_04888 [Bacteroides sp. 2_2_4]|nr:hypothetical protein BSCG_04888 [Bacteroides sp. 2_2_4]